MIKIAVPTRNNVVDDHFGHCEAYTMFTVNDQNEISDKESFPAPKGCGCKTNIASVLSKAGVKVLLAGNMGQGALDVLTAEGIEVVRGCSGDAESVAKEYLAGSIKDSGVGCKEHETHKGHAESNH